MKELNLNPKIANTFGFIGFGNMARMLIFCLLEYAHISPANIIVCRKNQDRTVEIKKEFPEIKSERDAFSVAKQSDIVFLCTKPKDIKEVVLSIKGALKPEAIVVSLAAGVNLDSLELLLDNKIFKYMPSITSKTKKGVSLLCFNDKVKENDVHYLSLLLSNFSLVKCLQESDWNLAMILSSCLPGFIANIFDQLKTTAKSYAKDLKEEEINEIILNTLLASAHLLTDNKLSFLELQEIVATKGGITAEGIQVLNVGLPLLLKEVFQQALAKTTAIETAINDDFKLY